MHRGRLARLAPLPSTASCRQRQRPRPRGSGAQARPRTASNPPSRGPCGPWGCRRASLSLAAPRARAGTAVGVPCVHVAPPPLPGLGPPFTSTRPTGPAPPAPPAPMRDCRGDCCQPSRPDHSALPSFMTAPLGLRAGRVFFGVAGSAGSAAGECGGGRAHGANRARHCGIARHGGGAEGVPPR